MRAVFKLAFNTKTSTCTLWDFFPLWLLRARTISILVWLLSFLVTLLLTSSSFLTASANSCWAEGASRSQQLSVLFSLAVCHDNSSHLVLLKLSTWSPQLRRYCRTQLGGPPSLGRSLETHSRRSAETLPNAPHLSSLAQRWASRTACCPRPENHSCIYFSGT